MENKKLIFRTFICLGLILGMLAVIILYFIKMLMNS